MGTISEKLTYLNGTKQLLKDKINNLGGSIDEQTTFRQYANQLQNVYNNLPKTSFQEGTEVTIEGGLKGKIDFDDGKVGFGQASQESTTGKNKLPPFVKGVRLNATNGTEESISTGATTDYIPVNFTTNPNWFLSGLTDTIHTTVWAYNSSKQGLHRSSNQNRTSLAINSSVFTGGTAQGTGDIAYIRVCYRVEAGDTGVISDIDNLKMQLEIGSSATDYEQYTGGYASPSPNWEQEVKCVAGRNKWGGFEYTRTFQNITLTFKYNNDGTFIVNGSNTSGSNQNSMPANIVLANNYYKKLSRGTHTIQGGASNITLQAISITDNSEVSILASSFNGESASFTLNETTKVYLRVQVATGTSFNNEKVYAMLEQGSIAHPYLPYNTIEIVESGKNLCDISTKLDNALITSNAITTGAYTLLYKYLKKGTYTISSATNIQLVYCFTDNVPTTSTTGITRVVADFIKKETFTITQDCYITYRILFYDGSTLDSDVNLAKINSEVQLEQGVDKTNFEPYHTPITYPISLGNIELCKIGDYVDTIEYDVDEDKVYENKNVNEHTFTENENISLQSINSYGIANFFISHSLGSVSNLALCNYFTLQTSGISVTQEEGFLWQHNGVYFRIKSSTASDVSSFKTWLGSHSVKVEYALAETTREDITGTLKDQIKALYNSQSFTGTTIIESNGDLPMIIKVRALKGE